MRSLPQSTYIYCPFNPSTHQLLSMYTHTYTFLHKYLYSRWQSYYDCVVCVFIKCFYTQTIYHTKLAKSIENAMQYTYISYLHLYVLLLFHTLYLYSVSLLHFQKVISFGNFLQMGTIWQGNKCFNIVLKIDFH